MLTQTIAYGHPKETVVVIGVQMKQTVLTVVLVMTSKTTRHAYLAKCRKGSHEIVDCNAPSNEQDDAAYRKCSWRKAKIPVKDPLDLNTQVDDQ